MILPYGCLLVLQTMLDMDNIHQFEKPPAPVKPFLPKNWKRPENTLYGYTGFSERVQEPHVLDEPLSRRVIRGYSGFIPQARTVCGAASVPTQKQQAEKEKLQRRRKEMYNRSKSPRSERSAEKPEEDENFLFPDTARVAASMEHFREYTRNLDLAERYEQAVERIMERGQTQEMLLRMVKAKISERVKSYSEQRVSLRKLFEAFDFNSE
jgi:flagellar biosynthesis GTPase FlhF